MCVCVSVWNDCVCVVFVFVNVVMWNFVECMRVCVWCVIVPSIGMCFCCVVTSVSV